VDTFDTLDRIRLIATGFQLLTKHFIQLAMDAIREWISSIPWIAFGSLQLASSW
jgi:hypothetical protein